jgi:hypothetical protein
MLLPGVDHLVALGRDVLGDSRDELLGDEELEIALVFNPQIVA